MKHGIEQTSQKGFPPERPELLGPDGEPAVHLLLQLGTHRLGGEVSPAD